MASHWSENKETFSFPPLPVSFSHFILHIKKSAFRILISDDLGVINAWEHLFPALFLPEGSVIFRFFPVGKKIYKILKSILGAVAAIWVWNSMKDGKEKEAQGLYPKSRSKSKCSNSNLITVTHYWDEVISSLLSRETRPPATARWGTDGGVSGMIKSPRV